MGSKMAHIHVNIPANSLTTASQKPPSCVQVALHNGDLGLALQHLDGNLWNAMKRAGSAVAHAAKKTATEVKHAVAKHSTNALNKFSDHADRYSREMEAKRAARKSALAPSEQENHDPDQRSQMDIHDDLISIHEDMRAIHAFLASEGLVDPKSLMRLQAPSDASVHAGVAQPVMYRFVPYA